MSIKSQVAELVDEHPDYLGVPDDLKSVAIQLAATEALTAAMRSLNRDAPVFIKYERPDDVGWAGWYEINSACVGHKALDGSFVPKRI